MNIFRLWIALNLVTLGVISYTVLQDDGYCRPEIEKKFTTDTFHILLIPVATAYISTIPKCEIND